MAVDRINLADNRANLGTNQEKINIDNEQNAESYLREAGIHGTFKKSSVGRKVGTVAGVAAYGTGLAIGIKKAGGIKSFIDQLKTFVDIGDILLVPSPQLGKIRKSLCNLILKNKGTRVGFIAGLATLGIASMVGLGRLVGHGVDKVRDYNHCVDILTENNKDVQND